MPDRPEPEETNTVLSGDDQAMALLGAEAPLSRASDVRGDVAERVLAANGVNIYSESTAARPFPPVRAGDRLSYRARLQLPLTTGTYSLRAGLYRVLDEFYATSQLDETKPMPFFVSGRTGMGGLVDLAADFALDDSG